MLLLIHMQCGNTQQVETISRGRRSTTCRPIRQWRRALRMGTCIGYRGLYRRDLGTLSIAGKAEFDEQSMRTARVGIGATYAAAEATGRVFGGTGHVFRIPGAHRDLRSTEKHPPAY